MSMTLCLAKIDEALTKAVLADPQALSPIFFAADDETVPAGLSFEQDYFEYDYRILAEIARAAADTDSWETAFPALAAVAGAGVPFGESLDEFEFCYGPAFLVPAGRVADLVAALEAEEWYGELAAADADATDDSDGADEEERDWDEFEDLLPFLRAAVREGKAIVGGVN